LPNQLPPTFAWVWLVTPLKFVGAVARANTVSVAPVAAFAAVLLPTAFPVAPAVVAVATPVTLSIEVVFAVATALPSDDVEPAFAAMSLSVAIVPIAVAVAVAVPSVDPSPPSALALAVAEYGEVTCAIAVAAPPVPT